MAFADLEEGDPEEANADRGHSDDRRGEEEHGQEEEEDVVGWEDAAGNGEDVVDRVEDLRVSEQEAAVRPADGIFDLVDASDQHAGEDEHGYQKEQQSTE